MTTERWRQIEEIFDTAVGHSGEDRERILAATCAGDHELRAEVEGLLAVDGQASAHLESVVQSHAEQLSSDISVSFVGRGIGVYRITGVLGRGGMGTVYAAVRTDDVYETTVALKVVKRGMDTDEVVRRFRQERRILARLQHPNIARILDGGTTPEGLPYFVMEYVDGQPITKYVASLPLRQRLALFRQVCSAVQHAHQNLVVHRDLKPGNILVTSDGVPKLLDFGIAKLLTPEDTAQTVTGLRMLTPDYASPEQKAGHPVTTATDVYSLGAVLRAILAGAKIPPEIALVIARATDADPDRRYASVEQLAEDVGRYAEGKPVLARGDSVVYRARKFVLRNKLAVAGLCAAVAGLVVGTTVAVIHAQRSQRQTEHIRAFANKMLFDVNDELAVVPGALSAREKLVKTGLTYLDAVAKELGTDPALQWELARAYERIANVQGATHMGRTHLGDFKGALASFRAALQLAEPLLLREPENSEYRTFTAGLYESIGTRLRGRPESVHHFRRAAELAADRSGPRATIWNRATMALAEYEWRTGDPHLSLKILRTLPATFSNAIWTAGNALAATGDLHGAVNTFQAAADRVNNAMSSYAANNPGTRTLLRAKTAALLWQGAVLGDPSRPNLGRVHEAVQLQRAAVASSEAASKWEERDLATRFDLGMTYGSLAATLAAVNPEESAAAYAKALGLMQQVDMSEFRYGQQELAPALSGYARVCLQLRRTAEAWKHARHSLEIQETVPGRNTLGDLMLAAGDETGALAEYRKALQQAENRTAEKPRMMPWRQELADTYERIAEVHRRANRCGEAAEWTRKSLAIWKDWSKWGVSTIYDQNRARRAEAALATCAPTAKRKI